MRIISFLCIGFMITNTFEMRKRPLALFCTLILVFFGKLSHAQHYANDFETQSLSAPWSNIHIVEDSTAFSGSHVTRCNPNDVFGISTAFTVGDELAYQNINLQFDIMCRFPDTIPSGLFAIGLEDKRLGVFWHGFPIAAQANDSARWFPFKFNISIPADVIGENEIKINLWNNESTTILCDDVHLTVSAAPMPTFLPETVIVNSDSSRVTHHRFNAFSIGQFQPANSDSTCFMLADRRNDRLTAPIYSLTEYILHNDTITEINSAWMTDFRHDRKGNAFFESTTRSGIGTTRLKIQEDENQNAAFEVENAFEKNALLLRHAIVMPFTDTVVTIYRRNQKIDSTHLQNAYYLDREGFSIGQNDRRITSYHQTQIASTQFESQTRTAYFNSDYWRDHPLIHYPLSSDTSDYFLDISCRNLEKGDVLSANFTLHFGSIREMPRIMPVPNGYEAAIIFTEHADWTDLRTQRAVLFGSEKIDKAENAIGGFVFHNIPVTKSVFFNNPDHVSNAKASHGLFKGPHATVETDNDFFELLQQIHGLGFEICLHTPEQYSTVGDNMQKALRFMKRHFGSPTWIDHGYNNQPVHNREDLICDGLNPESPQYAARLWRKNGVRYLWNAYYEENRPAQWMFSNCLQQPYGGFGDALPNRQITTLPNGGDFLLWSTPSTLEVHTNSDWNYFYNPTTLNRLVINHNVHITHIYPAWVNPVRAFWEYDADSLAVAMPGFNKALKLIADLRDARKMLPTTIENYLNFYESLLKVDYVIQADGSILLKNNGDSIKGLTLIGRQPFYVENKPYKFKPSEQEYMVWFDLDKHETAILKILK